ncbi:MAG: hypothetical protein IJU98_01000 [Synergistaceae bacterium]|nr:hypothetical protein [Synergistaceae bacterium]
MRRAFRAGLLLVLLFSLLIPAGAWADGYAGGEPKEESYRSLPSNKPSQKPASKPAVRRQTPAPRTADFVLPAPNPGPRRLSVVIFPTLNTTGMEVWESKYYPYNILEQKMTDYLEVMFKRSPLIEVRVLDEAGMNRWLATTHRPGDMAVQMELYEAILKEKHVIGTMETGRAQLRLRVFDAAHAQQIATRTVEGRDRRFTLDSAEDIFWLDAAVVGLPIPFENGLDLFGLTQGSYKGQKMSRPTWAQFQGTSHWQTIKNAIEEAYNQSMTQITNVMHSNDPNSALLAEDNFSTSFTTMGRILSPTANSKRRRREYIVSLGSQALAGADAVRVGDVLDVVRSDTYVTVVPDEPVVVIPEVIGQVKVIKVYEKNAIVRVVKDNKKEPITLKDLVVKKTSVSTQRKKGIF